MRLAILALSCFMMSVFFPLAIAEGVEQANNTAQNAGETFLKTITAAEAMQLARILAVRGERQQAKDLYFVLLRSRAVEIRIEAAFQLSGLFMAEKNYSEAINILRVILNQFPGLARVRLELARAYFLDENYTDAEFNFNLVKGSQGIPPEVIANIDMFLDAIRQRKNWSLNFGLSIVPDSNLNQASGEQRECVYTIFGLMCRDLEKEASGIGLKADFTGNYYIKFNKNLGLRNTVGLYLTDFKRSNYDDYILYFASGPRYIFSGGEISLQPTYTKRWIAHQRYSDSYGLRLDGQKSFTRLIIGAGVSGARNTYADDYIDEALHGDEYSAYFRPRYILSSQSYLQAGLSVTDTYTRNRIYSYSSFRYSLGWYYFFKYGFSVYLDYSFTQDKYKAERNYITQSYLIDSARRTDVTHAVSAILATNVFEKYGVTPTLFYTYTNRKSNIWSYEYARHRVNMAFDLKF